MENDSASKPLTVFEVLTVGIATLALMVAMFYGIRADLTHHPSSRSSVDSAVAAPCRATATGTSRDRGCPSTADRGQ
jgi:hypothetical protein